MLLFHLLFCNRKFRVSLNKYLPSSLTVVSLFSLQLQEVPYHLLGVSQLENGNIKSYPRLQVNSHLIRVICEIGKFPSRVSIGRKRVHEYSLIPLLPLPRWWLARRISLISSLYCVMSTITTAGWGGGGWHFLPAEFTVIGSFGHQSSTSMERMVIKETKLLKKLN